jgi:pSer/pThr/pTyr-binding forkhead associated (FHA) protein
VLFLSAGPGGDALGKRSAAQQGSPSRRVWTVSMSATGILSQRDRVQALETHPALQLGEYLAVEDGAEVVVLPLLVGVLHIGRSPSAGLSLDDATVSRRHALIVRDEQGTHILDDRSLNGVVVGGRRVSGAPLRDGDVILLGRVRLHYLRRG